MVNMLGTSVRKYLMCPWTLITFNISLLDIVILADIAEYLSISFPGQNMFSPIDVYASKLIMLFVRAFG